MFCHTTEIKALWGEEGWCEKYVLPMGNELNGFVEATPGRHLYRLYWELLRNTWTRHHSSHPHPWQSIADLLCCSGLVQNGCIANLSLFWERGRAVYYRGLTIKSSFLSRENKHIPAVPSYVGSRNWGSCPYSSWSASYLWEEKT